MAHRILCLLALLPLAFACADDAAGEAHGGSAAAEAGHPRHPHAAHRFEDAEGWAARFEDASRDAWQKPEVVLEALALAPQHVVADIGSATGYFPVRIATRVPQGRVWGVDIEPAMVRYLNERARREGRENLFSILGTPGDPLLPEPVDRVLMVNTYHHVQERTAYFRALAGHLAPDARLVIVDFEMGELPVGPPDAAKVPPAQVRSELEAAGFELERELHQELPYQYILVFSLP